MSDKKTKETVKKPVLPAADPANRIWGIIDDDGSDRVIMPVFDTVEQANAWLANRTLPEKKK